MLPLLSLKAWHGLDFYPPSHRVLLTIPSLTQEVSSPIYTNLRRYASDTAVTKTNLT